MNLENLMSRHNIQFLGPGPASTSRPTLMLAHGFGCDQQTWGPLAQIQDREYPLVLFDHMGCGQSDTSAYDSARYTHLSGYADDLVAIINAYPVISRLFTQTTFSSDIHHELHRVTVPTPVLYCDQDMIVPLEVIEYLNRILPKSIARKLNATGHYPHISNPEDVSRAVLVGVKYAD